MKRLLLLTDGIPPYVMGGMQQHSRLLCEHLARLGVKVDLFHYVPHGTMPTDEEVLKSFGESAREHIQVYTFSYEDRGRLPGHYLRAQFRMSQSYLERIKLLSDRPDFVYSKGFMGKAMLDHRDQLPWSVPVGVKFHGMNMFQRQPNWKGELTKYLLRPAVRSIMHTSDVVFSYGGKITDIIKREVKNPLKVVEFPSGVGKDWIRPVEDLRATPSRLNFLFVGRYDRLKGLPELHQVLKDSLILKDHSFTFVGPIPPEKHVQLPNVRYTGSLPDANAIRQLYDTHDVLICPSISEGMPNVIMEAMSRGLVVLATDVGATRILVDEQNGWLIRPGSRKEIEVALKEICSTSPRQLDQMKLSSVERMRASFLWEIIAAKFVDWMATFDGA